MTNDDTNRGLPRQPPTQEPGEPGQGAVLDALLSATRALVGVTSRSLGELDMDVTLTQFRTLMVLASRGPQRAIDVAGELAVNPSTGTRMCDRLVRKGLIRRTRRSGDRRVVWLVLTGAGRNLVAQASRRRREQLVQLVASIPPGRYAELIETLSAIAEAAGEPHHDGSWLTWPTEPDEPAQPAGR